MILQNLDNSIVLTDKMQKFFQFHPLKHASNAKPRKDLKFDALKGKDKQR